MKKFIAAVTTTGVVFVLSASGASAGHPTSVVIFADRGSQFEGSSIPVEVGADIAAFNTAIADLYSGVKGTIVGMGDVGGPVVAFA